MQTSRPKQGLFQGFFYQVHRRLRMRGGRAISGSIVWLHGLSLGAFFHIPRLKGCYYIDWQTVSLTASPFLSYRRPPVVSNHQDRHA
jgi:hypothetical protein